MHILLIHQAFASIDEAGGTRHHEIARHLVKLDHRVTVITGKVSYLTGQSTEEANSSAGENDDGGVEILRVFSFQKWHRSFLSRFVSFVSFMFSSILVGLSTREVDVVWGTSPPLFQGVSALIVARLKGAKFLFEVRDLWPQFAIALDVLRNPILIWLSEGLEQFLYRRADRVVINSPGFEEHVLEHGARTVDLIPNGVDVGMFSNGESTDLFTGEAGLEGKFIVLYAGAHGEANDLGVILEAASYLRANNDIRFVLLGDGKEKLSLVEKTKKMGLDNVLFFAPVPKREVPAVLASVDTCLAILKPIDEFKTTYPNKVFDYMAAGKPVILAIDGVIREVVEIAGAGVFVEPGDVEGLANAVMRMWEDRSRAERMGESGRAYVRAHFDRSKQVDALDILLRELIPTESH